MILLTQFCYRVFSQTKNQNIWESFRQKQPVDTPLVFAPGIISTSDFEFAITFSPQMDELFFTRRKPDGINKIFTMKLTGSKWSEPGLAFFSKEFFDFEPHISPDGKRLYFGSLRSVNNKQGLHQWYLEKINGKWTEPKLLNAAFTYDKMLMYLTSTMDQSIYFTIIRDGPNSGICYSEQLNNRYNSYTRLNENINRADSIVSAHPFIAPDESYLIYDCDNKDGFGSCDLYISFKNEKGEWSKSINLGNLINTDQCEMCASLSPDEKYLFFQRGNDKDIGDIYWVDFNRIRELKEKIKGNRQQK
jgi:hypothetical protein